jgi:hypothetical protein
MAQLNKIEQGLISGLVGNVVFVKGSKNATILRSRPQHTHQKASKKSTQNRNKFGVASQFIAPLYPVLKHSFTDKLGRANVRDALRSYVLKQVVHQGEEGFSILYAKMLMSTGRLRPYAPLSHLLEGLQIQLNWQDNSAQPFANATDELHLFLYVPATGTLDVLGNVATREQTEVIITLPASLLGATFCVYASFATPENSTYSFSTYVGLLACN